MRSSMSGWPTSRAPARSPRLVKTRWTGKQRLTDTYRWLNDLPLRDGDDALRVGWCELTTTDADGTVLYRNAWASSQPITEANVVAMVEAGRSRWKIENENNNTLKTQGLPLRAQLTRLRLFDLDFRQYRLLSLSNCLK